KLVELPEGYHTIKCAKDSDQSVKSSKSIKVTEDSTFLCTIHSNKNDIEIKSPTTIAGVAGNNLEVIDVTGWILSDAESELKQIGFINIKHVDENMKDSIWDSTNWIVVSQSIEAETVADKNDELTLVCKHKGDEISEEETSVIEEVQDAGTAYAYVRRFPSYNCYYFIDLENQTVRTFTSDSNSMLVGQISGSLDDGMIVCYAEDYWYEDIYLKQPGDYSKIIVHDRDIDANNEFEQMDAAELAAIINDGNHTDIPPMTEEEIQSQKEADEEFEQLKTTVGGPNDAVADLLATQLKDQYGTSYRKYSYDADQNMYQYYFKVSGALTLYSAAKSGGSTKEIRDLENAFDMLCSSMQDTLNIGMTTPIHVGVYLVWGWFDQNVLYFTMDGQKVSSELD
ncbi:MAG: PASTA domain-containing protein, partial [Firmicutes bacterium]|nr:PASTA domain-containing protein [Bacillota bacterium]